jgi:hypothetical protein
MESVHRWQEDGSDIVEEDASVAVGLRVEFQPEITAQTHILLFQALLKS